jgi:hypothetical protein
MTRQNGSSAHPSLPSDGSGDGMLVYRCKPSIIWTRELDRILLVDRERGTTWAVQGIKATIWDLLVLAYPYQRIVTFLSALSSVAAEEAKRVLLATLAEWEQEGIVESASYGEPGDQRRL